MGLSRFVEYAIGMEVFRWLCAYLFISRTSSEPPIQKIIHTVRLVAVPLLIPILFLIWRVFLFDNERKAADISLQTGAILGSPGTLLWWLVHFFQSVLNVSVFAWALPFNENFYFLRLKDILFAFGWMIVVIAISCFIHQLNHADDEYASARAWHGRPFRWVCSALVPVWFPSSLPIAWSHLSVSRTTLYPPHWPR
jgi:hypothetical protein